jgi:hypothetical protein
MLYAAETSGSKTVFDSAALANPLSGAGSYKEEKRSRILAEIVILGVIGLLPPALAMGLLPCPLLLGN